MPVALSNSTLPEQLVRVPVVSELDRHLRSSQGALYRTPLNDQERARRAAGILLLLTRRVLKVCALNLDPVERARIATLFVYESRSLLGQLRLLEINCDPGFGLIAARVRERLSQIRSFIAGMHDTLAAFRLIEVELLVLSGDLTAAHAVLEPLMLSISTIQARDLRDEVAVRYFDLSLSRMESRAAFLTLMDYLARRKPHGSISARFGRELRLIAAHAEELRDNGFPLTALVTGAWSRLAHTAPRRITAAIADIAMEQAGLAVVRRECRVSAQLASPSRAVRAMGGIGDLLMMTPGLRALSKRIGGPIEFAIPRRYLELFEHNPFVTALGIEDLPAEWYRGGRFIDLTDCPASIVESRTAPNVTVNRIEIFARALGVSSRELRQHGSQPVFEPSPAARQRAEQWLKSRHLHMRGFVAIQASAAEGYRTWNGMSEVARVLAGSMPVVIFDDKPWKESDHQALPHENVEQAIGLDLSLGFALACEARLIIAPDSALLHLAGARRIPCVGVFGPTDGSLRTSAYSQAVVVSRMAELPCAPCWRNQATPCMLTGGMSSECLRSLAAKPVIDAAVRLLPAAECPAASGTAAIAEP